LTTLKDSELENFSRHKMDQLTGNVHFPNPFPERDTVQRSLESYLVALSKVKNGSPVETVNKNTQREELENNLRLLALRCAQVADGDFSIYLSSGFEVKKERESSGIPTRVKNVIASDGIVSKTIALNWDSLEGVRSYVVELCDYAIIS
jgi:hypothetical protein